MREQIVAKRYARAYIDFASSKIGIDRCVDEMKGLKWIWRENRDFELFLRTPDISREDKAAVIDRVLSKDYADETRTFLKYLINRGRISLLPGIAEYIHATYAHGESSEVVLRTTFPLELELIALIKARVEGMLKKKTNFYLELDPDLLGGIQIIIGNMIIDGSVRNRLNGLKKQLLQAQVVR